MYPEELVAPMRADLTNNGFTELKDTEQVDSTLNDIKGTEFRSLKICKNGYMRT